MPAATAAASTKTVEVKRARPRGWNPGCEPAAAAQPEATPEFKKEQASAQFAHHVRGSLAGPILRYEERLKLLRQAEKLGVGRFEANLVIARVLNEQGMGQEVEWGPDRARKGWALPIGAFVVVQGLVVAGVWWLLRA
ncbi:MAG TPA: hypothetical protein VEA69_11820 [Tepidisphaeraceae bacterium]|nr:hypothetical protein [Tepidisphaeraceae bacterium]